MASTYESWYDTSAPYRIGLGVSSTVVTWSDRSVVVAGDFVVVVVVIVVVVVAVVVPSGRVDEVSVRIVVVAVGRKCARRAERATSVRARDDIGIEDVELEVSEVVLAEGVPRSLRHR